MPSERVLSLEKQKTDFHRSYKEKKLPPEFYQETSALPDEEAMELTALVKREVRYKLTTGRKNPPRKRG